MYRLSFKSLERLDGLAPKIMSILIKGITNSPFDFGIPKDGGLRTDKRQRELYAKGRTTKELIEKGILGIEGRPEERVVTWTLDSLHKPDEDGVGNAFDIFAYVDGRASWDMEHLEPIARHLQKIALEDFGVQLYWGYDLWKKDGAHFQIK